MAFPDWFKIEDGQVMESIRTEVTEALKRHNILILPRIADADRRGKVRWGAFGRFMDDKPLALSRIIPLRERVLAASADGINIGVEGLRPADRDQFTEWARSVASAFHEKGLIVTIEITPDESIFDQVNLSQFSDAIVLKAYDQHHRGGGPGPVAGRTWFDGNIDAVTRRLPPSKLIVAVGGHGYDWNAATPSEARPLGFDEAMLLACEMDAEVKVDGTSGNCTFTYRDASGDGHRVWFLDATTAWNQFVTIRRRGAKGISLWRLGAEEPAVWPFLGARPSEGSNPLDLATVGASDMVVLEGEGEFLRVREVAKSGRRRITMDGANINHSSYEALPRYSRVERRGKVTEKVLALTFDDGPDEKWTPAILDALRAHGVPGSFFVVGDQARRSPGLVRREYIEGHIIGNHTYYHNNLKESSRPEVRFELNATQRLIGSIIGRHTLLFRPPYSASSSPNDRSEITPLRAITEAGYVIVGGDIDSRDYKTPGAAAIVRNVLEGIESSPGSRVVVMHDAGGDRSQTVAALDLLIPLLRGKGYEFVGVDRLLGSSRELLMPPLSSREQMMTALLVPTNWFLDHAWTSIVVLFFFTTAIAVIRVVFLGCLVLRSARKGDLANRSSRPPVTILVPAYNESKVIGATIDALLGSDYPNLSVIVVDDGSTDETASIVASYGSGGRPVRLIRKPNGGKHSALNIGFEAAVTEYVVTIDADTQVLEETISRIMDPFSDGSVDAVCGNVQVGNVRNVLTAFQDVEYVTSQNYDRRAFDVLNCIPVVPGATGAWRRSTVLRAGGYSADTLTEDADLTLSVLAAGGKVVYAASARSVTEAPEGARAFFKQRLRWSYGTFQCVWKHRAHFGRGVLGCIALPNLLLFQVFFPILSPIGDLVLVFSAFRGGSLPLLAWYLTFLAIELGGSLVAFRLERRRWKGLWVVLIQRFYYRQLMYFVTFRALYCCVKGDRQRWNKLDRHASVVIASTGETA